MNNSWCVFFFNYDIKISLYDFESPYVVLRIIVFFTCSAGQLIAIRFFEDSIEQPYLKEILTLSTYLPMHQTLMGHYSNDSALVSYVSSAMRNIYLYIILLFIYIHIWNKNTWKSELPCDRYYRQLIETQGSFTSPGMFDRAEVLQS